MLLQAKSTTSPPNSQLIPAKNSQPIEARTLSWLSDRVARGRVAPFSEIVTITPEIAKRLLAQNAENRKVNGALVDQIVADIRGGFWEMNGEAIIISKDGELNDGQHRLTAVVLSGKSIESVVIFGVSRDSRYTVDMGRGRTAGDFLGMEGVSYATLSAAVARLHWLYRMGYYSCGKNVVITRQTARAEYWAHEKKIIAAIKFTESKFTSRSGATAIATAYMIILEITNDAASTQSFFHGLTTGENLKRGDACLALRARLNEAGRDRLKISERLELILRHWIAWRSGKSVSRNIAIARSFPKVER